MCNRTQGANDSKRMHQQSVNLEFVMKRKKESRVSESNTSPKGKYSLSNTPTGSADEENNKLKKQSQPVTTQGLSKKEEFLKKYQSLLKKT